MSTLTTIADAVKTKIEETIPLIDADSLGQKRSATVMRRWFAAEMTPEEAKKVECRSVFVIPRGREFIERSTRTKDRNGYRIGVLVLDKIPGEYGVPGKVDEREAFIDDAVAWVDTLFDALVSNSYEPVARAMLEEGEIREAFRVETANSYGLFCSEIDLVFSVIETN